MSAPATPAPVATSVGRRTARFRVPTKSIRGLLPLIVLLVVWQLLGSDDSVSFPRPGTWFTAIGDLASSGQLGPAVRTTLVTFIVSLVVAAVVGVALGMVIGASRLLERGLTPIMDFFRSLPPPAIVPPALLLLGASLKMSVTVVSIAIVWPILLNTITAMRAVPSVRIDMSRTLGLSARERLLKVVVPSLLPGIMVGVRIALSISLVVTLVVDILGSGEGLGKLITDRQQAFDAAAVWGLLLIIGVFGFLVNALISVAERRVLRNWPGAV